MHYFTDICGLSLAMAQRSLALQSLDITAMWLTFYRNCQCYCVFSIANFLTSALAPPPLAYQSNLHYSALLVLLKGNSGHN